VESFVEDDGMSGRPADIEAGDQTHDTQRA
jgi:hypothetical protein